MEMKSREDVIKALGCCIMRNPDDKLRCTDCPYKDPVINCLNRLKMDALNLLKSCEPHPIHCKDCGHCFELAATDPLTPYHGGKEGFFCAAWDTDFYAPHVNPDTYYCADAKPRE